MKSFLLGAKTEVKPALPYDAEVAYLGSTGTQCIDTGLSIVKFSVRMTAALDVINNWSNLFGAQSSSGASFAMLRTGASGHGGKLIGMYATKEYNSQFVPAVGRFYDIEAAFGAFVSLSIDGEQKYGSSNTSYPASMNHLLVFARTNSSGAATEFASMKLKSFALYDESGSELFDLIPVRVGQVGMMYDRVSRQLFGNSGTGAFVVGPDKEVA